MSNTYNRFPINKVHINNRHNLGSLWRYFSNDTTVKRGLLHNLNKKNSMEHTKTKEH